MNAHAYAAGPRRQHAKAALLCEPLSFATETGGLALVPPGRCLLLRADGAATLSWRDGPDYRELALSPADLCVLLSSGTLKLEAPESSR